MVLEPPGMGAVLKMSCGTTPMCPPITAAAAAVELPQGPPIGEVATVGACEAGAELNPLPTMFKGRGTATSWLSEIS